MPLAFPIVKSVLNGVFVWARRALNSPKRRFPARAGDTQIMRMLLAAGAEVDHQNSAGMTALHRAALHGCNRAARMLLNANARPELRNKAGLSCVEINSDPEMRRIVVGSQLRLAQGSRAGARGSAVRPPSELRKVRPL